MCKNFSLYVARENNKQFEFFRARCKQWKCEECAKQNAKIWRAYLLDTINKRFDGHKWSFVTITLPSRIHKLPIEKRITASIEAYRKRWNKLMMKLKYTYGKFEYVRVIEMHKNKVLHIHCIFNFHFSDIHEFSSSKGDYSYSKSLKNILVSSGFGFICNVQNLIGHAGYTTKYITKYMTKEKDEFHQAVSGLRVRRIQTSRGIGSPKEQEGVGTWEIKHKITASMFEAYREAGIEVYDLNRKKSLDWDDFCDKETGEILETMVE